SPDGTNVYVASAASSSAPNQSAIVTFNRTSTGTLNQVGLSATQKCAKTTSDADGCLVQSLLDEPRDIEVTPDGKQVLVTNASLGTTGCASSCYSLLAMDRGSNGVLSNHPGNTGCISYFVRPGCTARTGGFFYGPTEMAITNDGRRIYTVMRGCC